VARITGISAPVSTGSGFVVDADGLVVTNEHVIHGAASVQVTLRDGRAFTPVTLVAVDRPHDLALLRIDARALPTAPVSQDDVVAVGTHATAIGSPLGLSYTLTDGLISAARDVEGTSFLQIETAIAPGSSGGPLFDPRGRVIGVTTATRAASLNFALHPRYVRALLARPRTPRALEPFVPEATVTGLEVEGAEASPVERMNLGGAARIVAAGVESCRARAPNATRITVRYDSAAGPGTGRPTRGPISLRRGRVDSDLGRGGEACLGDNLRLAGISIIHALEEDHDDEIRAGEPIAVRFEISLGRGAADAAARVITVRYEVAPRHDAGAADDDRDDGDDHDDGDDAGED
jgi:S1-C subfamily serine protease